MPKILLMTGSEPLRRTVIRSLDTRGVECDEARTVPEAQEFLGKNRYEIIILDTRLLRTGKVPPEDLLKRIGSDSLLLAVAGSRIPGPVKSLLEEKSGVFLSPREAGKALPLKIVEALDSIARKGLGRGSTGKKRLVPADRPASVSRGRSKGVRIRGLLDRLEVGILFADPNGNVSYMNRKARK